MSRELGGGDNAITIDLTGQIGASHIGPTVYSGTGGHLSYAMGAFLSSGGRYICVLPSTAVGGTESRVTPQLEQGQIVTVSRDITDIVVTEYGVAHLLNKTEREPQALAKWDRLRKHETGSGRHGEMAQEQASLDPGRMAVVIMDFQNGIVSGGGRDPQGTVERAASVLAAARAAGAPVVYIAHRGGRFEEDSPDAEIHPGVAPAEGERVIGKTAWGSFSTTGLDMLLRELGRDTLVLMGVSTSGCVLSTVRWGADIGYQLVVVGDACDDGDEEVHRVLTEKVFPRQATVLNAQEFVAAVGAR